MPGRNPKAHARDKGRILNKQCSVSWFASQRLLHASKTDLDLFSIVLLYNPTSESPLPPGLHCRDRSSAVVAAAALHRRLQPSGRAQAAATGWEQHHAVFVGLPCARRQRCQAAPCPLGVPCGGHSQPLRLHQLLSVSTSSRRAFSLAWDLSSRHRFSSATAISSLVDLAGGAVAVLPGSCSGSAFCTTSGAGFDDGREEPSFTLE